ncbi:MAG: hypothetical protein WAO91_03950 [Candidatus Nitrosotenuis sp.]
MVDLNMIVLQNFTFSQVIEKRPLADSELRRKIEAQVSFLVRSLQTKDRSELEEILADQLKIKRELGKISGAMALDQPKIALFYEFIANYIKEI